MEGATIVRNRLGRTSGRSQHWNKPREWKVSPKGKKKSRHPEEKKIERELGAHRGRTLRV